MAIIQCPECGRNISDKAEDCIHCGFPLKQKTDSLGGTLVIYGYTGFFLVYPKLKIYLDGQYICDVSHKSKSAVIPINKPTEVEIKCGIRSTLVRVQPDMHNEIYTEFDRSLGNILVDLRCSPIRAGGGQTTSGTASTVPNSSEPSPAPQIVIQNKSVKKLWAIIIFVLVGTFTFALLNGIGKDNPKGNLNEHYINCAKQLVSEQLKSPATASYSNCVVEEIDQYGRIMVSMAVDSQNGFGAYIRKYAIVILQTYDSKEETFTYKSYAAVQFYDRAEYKSSTANVAKSLNHWNEPL